MRVVYYTSGITGSGRVVRGLSIWNALQRAELPWEYTILSSAPFAHLAERLGVSHVEVPLEPSARLGPDTYEDSQLFQALSALEPDVLLVDLYWMPLYAFVGALSCKKVFMSRQVADRFFSIPFQGRTLSFRPEDYDLVLATEPFSPPVPMRHINPMVIRNRDEILSRDEALAALDLDADTRNCLLAYNGEPGEFEEIRNAYSYLEQEGYRMVYSTNYDGGLFPAVHYFNAFDLVICSAAYNSFWEAVHFRKKAIFVPVARQFENQAYRVEKLQDHRFEENGADQLVRLLGRL